MDYLLQGMGEEKSLTKVVGLFAREAEADIAVRRLLRLPGMRRGQVRLLGPQHAGLRARDLLSEALEPEPRGPVTTLLVTHAVAGMLGAMLGLLAFGYLIATSEPAVLNSPLLAFMAIVGFGTTFGLMLGAMAALRPDRVWVIRRVRSALRKRQWVVVAHATDTHQTALVQDLLGSSEAQLVRSL